MTTNTDGDRERALINAALTRIEQRLYAGTATAEETVDFLRLGGEL